MILHRIDLQVDSLVPVDLHDPIDLHAPIDLHESIEKAVRP